MTGGIARRIAFALAWFAFAAVGRADEFTSSSPAAATTNPSATVRQIKVQPDKAPDSSSLKSIVESVTRGCKTNDQRAIAIYNYCMLTNYHLAYPSEPGGIPALKEINCYGWSLCGGLHTVESALWIAAGWEHRYVGWNGHTTVEAKYDGRWHYLDIFLKFYAWEPDGKGGRTIASEDDLTFHSDQLIAKAFVLDKSRGCVYAVDNQFVMNGDHANWRAPALLSCGDTISDVIGGLKTHHAGGPEAGWAGINHDTGDYSTDVNLAPGFSLTNNWDPANARDDYFWASQQRAPAHTCGNHKDTRNDPSYGLILEPYVNSEPAQSFANGTIGVSIDCTSAGAAGSFVSLDNAKQTSQGFVPVEASKQASVVMKLESPYIISGRSTGPIDGADKLEVSVDGGTTYKLTKLEQIGIMAKGKLDALVRVGFSKALKSVNLSIDVQNNPGALPYLSPGKNVVSVAALDPKSLGDNKLVVTYAYRLGSRTKSFDDLCEEGKEIAKQHNAKWSDKITIAQKVFTANDLPGTLEIDCPTPKGEYPVYPRMVFVRREFVSASGSPLPLPAGSVAAKVAPADELATLPNPFLIGTQEPVKAKPVALKTTQIPLTYVEFVNEKGEISTTGSMAWPKNAAEKGKVIKGAVVYTGDFQSLPKGRELLAARLVFPVISGHDKAAGKVGVVVLRHPVEKESKLDFSELTDDRVVGTTVVPQQPGDSPRYNPAKPMSIDVTSAARSIASHQAESTVFALRIVPDRGIDDGWTVRCQISPADGAYLEIDTKMAADSQTISGK